MTALHCLPAYKQAQLIASGEVSCVEITQAYLDRIDTYNDTYCAFITPTPELALQQALDADIEISKHGQMSPLHGLPIALKDAYDTAGVRTTVCTKLFANRVPTADSQAWHLLRRAGAVLLGKLECTEFCLGGPAKDGLVPHARNPWDPARYAGGSSSGAGVALASRMAALTLGSDTGGSIRIPAAFCGVAGHKPTYGLVSLRGIYPLSGSLDHAGPLASCAADCALLLDAIAEYDAADPASVKQQPMCAFDSLSTDLKGVRVGFAVNFTELPSVSKEMQQSTKSALHVLEDLGAEIVPIELPDLWDFTICNSTIMMSEAFSIHQKNLQEHADKYTQFTRSRITLGSMISATDYLNAQKVRRELAESLKQCFANVDVFVYPGMLDDPPLAEQIEPFYFLQTPLITAPANVGGIPTASVCSGFSKIGMPQAIQISGRWFEDATVLRVAHAYELAVGFTNKLPPGLDLCQQE